MDQLMTEAQVSKGSRQTGRCKTILEVVRSSGSSLLLERLSNVLGYFEMKGFALSINKKGPIKVTNPINPFAPA
jgi:hypothetical protein